MTRVVYIAGLGHSGSTILDMSLGCHPSVVGMGELTSILNLNASQLEEKTPQLTCSCREDVAGCPFWSQAIQSVKANSSRDYATKYQGLLEVFRAVYGDRHILVDSSKSLRPLSSIKTIADLRIIYLIRDVRGWIYSRHTMSDRSMVKLAYWWLFKNQRIKADLERQGITYLQVGYEEFALYPELILGKICDFLEIDFHSSMLSPDHSGSHVISGNIARHDKEKRKRIFYDNRWFMSEKLSQLSPLIYPALRFNSRNTYTNMVTRQEASLRGDENKRHPEFLFWSGERKKRVIREKRQILDRNRSEPGPEGR
jgi:Sulfotransferase family